MTMTKSFLQRFQKHIIHLNRMNFCEISGQMKFLEFSSSNFI
jgi:hypothetical protein